MKATRHHEVVGPHDAGAALAVAPGDSNGAGSRRGHCRREGRIESVKDVERWLCHLEFSFSIAACAFARTAHIRRLEGP
jgi:hypothetical protein